MFMDIVGYSSMVQESENKALEFVRIHKELVEKLSEQHGGEVMNYYGDASLTMFESAIEATRCAVNLQEKFHNEYQLPMRIGIHLGEVVFDNETIYGNGVNIASRLESMGVPGSVLISEAVHVELENQDSIQTSYIGEYKFKNISKPLNVFAINNPVLVLPEARDLKSDKSRNIASFNIIGAILGIILLGLFLFSNNLIPGISKSHSSILDDKLIVPTFKNFTGNEDFDYIGEMAAHRITKELFEISGTNILNYRTQKEINRVNFASLAPAEISYAREAGAVNYIEGSIQQFSKDSLIISALIKDVAGGEVLETFPNVAFSKDDPVKGIRSLSQYIHGYWEVKDQFFMAFPKLEAYKLYLKAKETWREDYPKSEEALKKAIEIDPEFYDAHALLLSLYYNTKQAEKAQGILSILAESLDEMTPSLRSRYEKYVAYWEGNHKRAKDLYQVEYQQNPEDLFINTGYMVICNEFVHDYKESIEVFKAINLNSLSIEGCSYCEVRVRVALVAAMGTGNWTIAEELVNAFPPGYKNMRSNVLQFRYYGLKKDTEKVDEIVERILGDSILSNAKYVRYYAARELFNTQNQSKAKELSRAHIEAMDNKIHTSVAWSHYFLGDYENSRGVMEMITNQNGSSIKNLGLLGVVEARLGNADKALAIAERINTLDEERFGDIPYYQSWIYYHLGQKEKALEQLGIAIKEGAKFFSSNVFENDPIFLDLKDDPQFQEVIFPYTE